MFKKISVTLSFVLCAVMVAHAAPRATDLNRLVERFDQLVTPESEQDELTFTQEWVKISAKNVEDRGLGQSIAKLALERIGSDISLERFEVREISLSDKQDLNSEVIDPIFSLWNSPFFCYTFKSLTNVGDSGSEKKCRSLTRKLLADLVSVGESTHLVTVEGNAWGEYKQVFLLKQSETDPEQFLLYDFDIVHEI